MQRGSIMVAIVAGSVVWATLYGFGAYWLGHEAKHVAGPIAIGICAMVVAALVIAGLYMSAPVQLIATRSAQANAVE